MIDQEQPEDQFLPRKAGRPPKRTLDGPRPTVNAAELAVGEYRPQRLKTAEVLDVMEASGMPNGYVGYWAKDVGTRIHDLLQRGYGFVNDQHIYIGDKTVLHGTRPEGAKRLDTKERDNNGKPIYYYLMMIRKDWYEEDQKIKAKIVEDTVAAMTEGDIKTGNYKSLKQEYE